MILFFVIHLLLSASALSAAEARRDCDCERFRSLVSLVRLHSDIAKLGSLFEASDTTLGVSPSLRFEGLRSSLASEANTIIPKECYPYLLGPNASPPSRLKASLVLRGSFDTQATVPSASSVQSLLTAYDKLAWKKKLDCKKPTKATGAGMKSYAKCLVSGGLKAFDEFQKDFSKMGDKQLGAELGDAGLPGLASDEIRMLQIYNHLLGMAVSGKNLSADAVSSYLKSKNLSYDQVLLVANLFGSQGNVGYEKSREKKSASADGAVTLAQILSAARHNTGIRFTGKLSSFLAKYADFAGVCRDIHDAMRIIVQSAGKIAYDMALVTRSGEYDVALYTQNPAKRQSNVLSFSKRFEGQPGDWRALHAGNPGDATFVTYRVDDGHGHKANVLAGGARVNLEAMGLDPRTYDPGINLSSNIGVAAFQTEGKNSTRIGVAIGSDGVSEYSPIFTITQNYAEGTVLPGTFALAFGSQTTPLSSLATGGASKPPTENLTMDYLFAVVEQHLYKSPDKKISKSLEANLDTFATLLFMAGTMKNGPDERAMNVQGDVRLTQRFQLTQKIMKKQIEDARIVYSAQAQATLGLRDMRNVEMPGAIGFVLTYLSLGAEARKKISLSMAEQAYLLAALHIIINETGVRCSAMAGVATSKAGAAARYDGPCQKNVPYFLDNSLPSAGVDLFWRPNPRVTVGISGKSYLDMSKPNGAAMGTFNVNFE